MTATPEASSSAFQNIVSATTNATSQLSALPADLAHFLANAASFAFIKVPERIDHIIHGGGSIIAEATGNESGQIISAALSKPLSTAQASITGKQYGFIAGSHGGNLAHKSVGSVAINHMRSLGGFFTYITSRWALATAVLAMILNRTQIYASMRRRVRLTWPVRLMLRLVPIMLFLSHALTLLQAMRCQTSSHYSRMRYGDAEERSQLDFAGDGGLIHRMSSAFLFLESEEDSCRAVGMIPPPTGEWRHKGSLSLFWPLFQSLWLGQFVETVSTVLQGRPPATETGMSIFEHSLAFAEAEGVMSTTLGIAPFRLSRPKNLGTNLDGRTLRTVLQRMNTPPENLLISLISTMNGLSSQVLGVLDMQSRFRLVNTGAWGFCYLASLLWGFYTLRPENGPDDIIMRFPIVCIVGFTPHLLILGGIMICTSIYTLALFLCFLSPPREVTDLSFSARLRWAYQNMQAYTQFPRLRVEMRQDFYTALLQVGFTALTAASEAVFLNECPQIKVAQWTWLEQQRMDEYEHRDIDLNHPERCRTNAKRGSEHSDSVGWSSGYAKQKLHRIPRTAAPQYRTGAETDGGVGAYRRLTRCLNVYHLFKGIFWLFGAWLKLLINACLDKVRISQRPAWLRVGKVTPDSENLNERAQNVREQHLIDFWMLSDEGVLSLPDDDNVDVAEETERRLKLAHEDRQTPTEEQLSSHLYDWWKHGGWWGQRDESGSYAPSIQEDEDATSVVSMSTASNDWVDEDDEDAQNPPSGRSTPTQARPYAGVTRSPTPSADYALDPAHLASLLDPKDDISRREAKILAHHLTAPSITTRSRYAHAQVFANAKVLTSTRDRPPGSTVPTSGPLTPDEEAQLLEQIILSRRAKATRTQPTTSATGTWDAGGTGTGSSGPSCVVCQNAPRSVLAWPCRCLSLCEDCRVNLAMNNFSTCVCCRQDVMGFSRLFVP